MDATAQNELETAQHEHNLTVKDLPKLMGTGKKHDYLLLAHKGSAFFGIKFYGASIAASPLPGGQQVISFNFRIRSALQSLYGADSAKGVEITLPDDPPLHETFQFKADTKDFQRHAATLSIMTDAPEVNAETGTVTYPDSMMGTVPLADEIVAKVWEIVEQGTPLVTKEQLTDVMRTLIELIKVSYNIQAQRMQANAKAVSASSPYVETMGATTSLSHALKKKMAKTGSKLKYDHPEDESDPDFDDDTEADDDY